MEVEEEGDGEDKLKTFPRKWGFLWTEVQIEFHFLQRSVILSHSCNHYDIWQEKYQMLFYFILHKFFNEIAIWETKNLT